jgi:hypothetical protein
MSRYSQAGGPLLGWLGKGVGAGVGGAVARGEGAGVGGGDGVALGEGVGDGDGEGVGVVVGLPIGDGATVCTDPPASDAGRMAMTVTAMTATTASARNEGAVALVVGRRTVGLIMDRSSNAGALGTTVVRPSLATTSDDRSLGAKADGGTL